ncbi:MAG: hypothetical protein ACRC4U_07425, partial [Shewanella sp.]
PLDWQGCEIRYTTNLSETNIGLMTRLNASETFYTESPVEKNAPIEGAYRFAFLSRDTSGNLSLPSFVNIALPKRRTGNVYEEFFEDVESWQGALSGFIELPTESGIGTYLEAIDATSWDALTTWDAWARWNQLPASPCIYTAPARDLGTVLAGQMNARTSAEGAVLLELRFGNDGLAWSAWGSIAAPFTARWIQVRCTVSATGGQPVPTLREMSYDVSVDLKQEYLNDVNISTLSGVYRIGVGDIRIPLANTYTIIKSAVAIIQDSRAGQWTWQRFDNTTAPTPRLQFKLNGTLADPAFVDFDVKGI